MLVAPQRCFPVSPHRSTSPSSKDAGSKRALSALKSPRSRFRLPGLGAEHERRAAAGDRPVSLYRFPFPDPEEILDHDAGVTAPVPAYGDAARRAPNLG